MIKCFKNLQNIVYTKNQDFINNLERRRNQENSSCVWITERDESFSLQFLVYVKHELLFFGGQNVFHRHCYFLKQRPVWCKLALQYFTGVYYWDIRYEQATRNQISLSAQLSLVNGYHKVSSNLYDINEDYLIRVINHQAQ